MQIILLVELPWSGSLKNKANKNLANKQQQSKNFFSRFSSHHLVLKSFGTIFSFILILIGIYIYISNNEGTVATLTDNYIRPLLGNQTTINLEALFFNVDDQINQIKYKLYHPNDTVNAFSVSPTPSLTSVRATPTPSTFLLTPVKPLSEQLLTPGEGEWESLASTNGAVLLAKTSVHPDINRPYAVVDLVKMNMEKLAIGITAGTVQPGGPAKPGPGKIPQTLQQNNTLIAAFNGGFQQKDGYYGMILGSTTYLPLQKDLATLVMYQDQKPALLKYTGQALGDNIIGVRQNCPMLIEEGKIVTSSSAWDMQTWGLTTTNTMYTWRSGLGITKEGDLIYAAGSSLVPETLARALLAAGAVNAMQLDINPFWVRFVLFSSQGEGKYQYKQLNPEMVNGGYEYLHGYQKDFFYVYKK